MAKATSRPITRLRPHQIEIIGALHGAARKAFLLSAAGLAALPLVLLVLAAALAVEFQLMLHTMVTLLDDGTGNQPITLLGLSSLIAIVALHVLTRQPGSEAIHRWMMRLGLVALVLFLLGLGLIVAMASFEVAAAMLFDPATGIDGLDSWLAGTEREAEDESLVAFLRDLFADYGGLIALVLASLGLGGVFFLTVLVSHFLIGLALKLAGEFITALTRVRESARLKAVMLAADAALAAAAHKVARHNAVSPATAVREAVATLTAKADSALSHPRRVVQAADLIKPDEAGDPLAGLGSKLLGLPAEVGTLDMPALKTLLADLDQAITEDTLFDIALSVAINELGLTDNDREMFDD
ncbi:hypothetical protein EV659_108153 [Rhodothalassium salexigens DSM 2132]|uniref:Uncharacterized protein n=1 Tax=Rhodothalassium salexigens DSM 2132 TaxID=1188247 RepID=A0A4R2PD28_RHOSA|nr:hypothetical protein [Rhodothalassium salexigens]MBB4212178.1 hypothetical protein [Rhodothalassium salexigens DSM 2132]TCP33052.1 hypothetical protein EV659_108153 [Rhodothalassium salexigens DSM 2132]